MMLATRMMPPIFCKYCLPFSHVCRAMAFLVGKRYGGSSITKGVSSPFTKNRLKILLIITAMSMPTTYIEIIIAERYFKAKNVPVIMM